MTAPQPVRFLHALGSVFTSVGLYRPGHPAREGALEGAFDELEALLDAHEAVVYSFLEGEVVFGEERLPELDRWPWTARLARAGVERLEFFRGADLAEWRGFVAEMARRLELSAEPEAAAPHPHIRYGSVAVETGSAAGRKPVERGAGGPPLELGEEAEAVRWIHEQAEETETAPTQEAAAVVRALFVAVRSARDLVAPLLEIKQSDEYTTNHCINVSVLAMTLAEEMRLADADVLAIGEAALLHDIGKTHIPRGVLNKRTRLTPEERQIVERHAVEGARMLLRSDERNVLTAVVAYEHHMHWNGEGGYPRVRVSYQPHRFSLLVQVCDVYDALRTRRSFRPPFTREAATEFLRRRSGSEFDPETVKVFLSLMSHWKSQRLSAEGEEPEGEAAEMEGLIQKCGGGYDADIEQTLYES